MHKEMPRDVGWVLLGFSVVLTACTGGGSTSTDSEAGPDSGVGGAPAQAAVDASMDAAMVTMPANETGKVAAQSSADASIGAGPCLVRAPTACPDPPTRYVDVAPIFEQRCVNTCHSPRWNGPWPLDAYEHVADWQDTIRTELLGCTMPPRDAGVPITLEEQTAILTWIRCGIPR